MIDVLGLFKIGALGQHLIRQATGRYPFFYPKRDNGVVEEPESIKQPFIILTEKGDTVFKPNLLGLGVILAVALLLGSKRR